MRRVLAIWSLLPILSTSGLTSCGDESLTKLCKIEYDSLELQFRILSNRDNVPKYCWALQQLTTCKSEAANYLGCYYDSSQDASEKVDYAGRIYITSFRYWNSSHINCAFVQQVLINNAHFMPPRINFDFTSTYRQKYRLGYKLLLVCVARGIPQPEIIWHKKDQPIRDDERFAKSIVRNFKSKNQVKARLEIESAMVKDAGMYICKVNNGGPITKDKYFNAEYVESSIQLLVGNKN